MEEEVVSKHEELFCYLNEMLKQVREPAADQYMYYNIYHSFVRVCFVGFFLVQPYLVSVCAFLIDRRRHWGTRFGVTGNHFISEERNGTTTHR